MIKKVLSKKKKNDKINEHLMNIIFIINFMNKYNKKYALNFILVHIVYN